MSEKEKLIFSKLPKSTKEAVLSNPKKRREMKKIIDKIYEEHGYDLLALAN